MELLDYPETISARWTKTKTAGDAVASLNTGAAVPMLAVLGDTNFIGDGNFTLTKMDWWRARGKIAAGRPAADEGISVKLELSGQRQRKLEKHLEQPLALPAQELVVGTAAPMDVDDNNFVITAARCGITA